MRTASTFRWAAYAWAGAAVLCVILAALGGQRRWEWVVAGVVALLCAAYCERAARSR